jgi:Protein of unknown function (DUF1207)
MSMWLRPRSLALVSFVLVSASLFAQAPSPPPTGSRPQYELQYLPYGLLYRSYIAGPKESRIGAQWLHNPDVGWVWETAFGARIPAWRYGTKDPLSAEGWQMDVEGAAFTRIDVGTGTDVDAVDFRTGFLLTHRRGRNAWKAGIYHISSHLGDEFLERHPNFRRRDYVRDSLIVGVMQNLTPEIEAYGEMGYAYLRQDGAEPFEVQLGIQYNPLPRQGSIGRPFAAVNAHFRQEFGLRPSMNAVGGVQWRSGASLRAVRFGLQYFNGQSLQYSFYDDHEAWLAIGAWLDM